VSSEAAGVQPLGMAAGGVIHDIGYREYAGERLGRAQIVRALAVHGLRTAFGFGRGAKAKVFPALLFVLMCLPAVISVAAMALNPGNGQLVPYDTYQSMLRPLVLLVFVALQAPNLVSGDLRYHTLPLYFSRPIGRADYPIAKLIGFTAACLLLIEVPLLILWAGTISQVHGASAVWHQTTALGPGLLYGAAWALLLASISLALASSTGKRVFSICAVAIPLFVTWVLATALSHIGLSTFQPATGNQPPALASLAGLINPFTVLNGVTDWFGSAPRVLYARILGGPGGPGGQGPPGGRGGGSGTFQGAAHAVKLVGNFGPLYGVMFVLLLALAIGGLLARYRKVGIA
jgi:ABC-2 type transport system permease protein